MEMSCTLCWLGTPPTEETIKTQRGQVFTQSHTAQKWQSKNLKLDVLPAKPELLTTTLHSSVEG